MGTVTRHAAKISQDNGHGGGAQSAMILPVVGRCGQAESYKLSAVPIWVDTHTLIPISTAGRL
jgi:hypothetical protein